MFSHEVSNSVLHCPEAAPNQFSEGLLTDDDSVLMPHLRYQVMQEHCGTGLSGDKASPCLMGFALRLYPLTRFVSRLYANLRGCVGLFHLDFLR
jgi:hypothetical protein